MNKFPFPPAFSEITRFRGVSVHKMIDRTYSISILGCIVNRKTIWELVQIIDFYKNIELN